MSQTVTANKDFIIEALYDKSKNKTTILVKKKGSQIQKTTVTGLAVIKLTTSRGVINYSW